MAGRAISLRAGALGLRVSTRGGAILRFDLGGAPLLRPAPDDSGPADVACFPLAPLGNRIRGNAFAHAGQRHRVTPNVAGEPLHLHGESWLAEWRIEALAPDRLLLSHRYDGARLPHRYHLRQLFELDRLGLHLRLALTNLGAAALPFGLGWHPFFPLSPGLRLTTSALAMWSEGGDHLPLAKAPVPPKLDFAAGGPLPAEWINNAFSGWSGRAALVWPDRGLRLDLRADPVFDVMQLYRPAPGHGDFFALEPMSHLPGALPDPQSGPQSDPQSDTPSHGLHILDPGESLAGSLHLSPAQSGMTDFRRSLP